MKMGYKTKTQEKNLAWFLPRPKKDRYKGGMPLYCEEWLLELALDLLNKDKATLLNLFCGMNKYGYRIDIKSEVQPHSLSDAHKVTQCFPHRTKFDIILADPPYSNEESEELYGIKTKLQYKKWTAECDNLLMDGGLLIVYHKYVMPNPNPDKFEVIKRVFVGNRTYHLPRVAIFFRKKTATQINSSEATLPRNDKSLEFNKDLTAQLRYAQISRADFVKS